MMGCTTAVGAQQRPGGQEGLPGGGENRAMCLCWLSILKIYIQLDSNVGCWAVVFFCGGDVTVLRILIDVTITRPPPHSRYQNPLCSHTLLLAHLATAALSHSSFVFSRMAYKCNTIRNLRRLASFTSTMTSKSMPVVACVTACLCTHYWEHLGCFSVLAVVIELL